MQDLTTPSVPVAHVGRSLGGRSALSPGGELTRVVKRANRWRFSSWFSPYNSPFQVDYGARVGNKNKHCAITESLS